MLEVPAWAWSWRLTALLLLTIAVPYAAAVAVTARADGWTSAALVSGLLASAVILGAAGLLFLRSKISSDPRQGWLLLLMTAWAVDAVSRTGLRAIDPASYDARAAWMVTLDVVVAAGALALLVLAQKVVLTLDPLPAGLLLGLLAASTRVVLLQLAEPRALPDGATVLAGLTVLALYAAIALGLLKVPGAPEWARAGLALSVVLLSLAEVLAYHHPMGGVRIVATILTNLAASLLLAGVAGVLVNATVRARRRELRWLQSRLLEAELRQRRERARMHEIAGTVAGIVSATRLLRGEVHISEEHRQQLDGLVDTEITRLQDLMSSRHDGRAEAARAVDLDEALYPLVMSLEARGNPVQWRPSGLSARVSAEDVSRAVTLLIDNVVRHAPGSETVVEVSRAGETVEIRIADRGPGVPPEAREHLFEPAPAPDHPEPPRPRAHGLHLAQRLVREQGGYLRLADSTTSRGAEFVIGLPAAHRETDDGHDERGDGPALAGPRRRGGSGPR